MAYCRLCEDLGVVCCRKEGFMGYGETRTATINMDNGTTRTFPNLAPILECEVVNETMSSKDATKLLKSSSVDFGKLTLFP